MLSADEGRLVLAIVQMAAPGPTESALEDHLPRVLTFSALISNWRRKGTQGEEEMGSVAVGAMVVGTSLLVVALAMATLESQVDDSFELEQLLNPLHNLPLRMPKTLRSSSVIHD